MAVFTSSTLKIFFWNARSLNTKSLELRKEASSYDILICVETWLKPGTRLDLPGFVSHRLDRLSKRAGGLPVWVRRGLTFSVVSADAIHVSLETLRLRFENLRPALDIVIYYRPPDVSLSQDEWDRKMHVGVNNRETIIVGDFNARNANWNCPCCDTSGLYLDIAYKKNNLFLHNFNTLSYADLRRNYRSNLDLVFSTQKIKNQLSVSASDDPLGSDHHPVLINVSVEKYRHVKIKHKINSVRTNWPEVHNFLEEKFSTFLSRDYDDLDAKGKYECLVTTLTEAILANTPNQRLVSKRKHINPVPWWDLECDRAKRLRKAALKKYEFTLDLHDLIDLNFRTNPSHVWNSCKIFKNKWVNIKPGGNSNNAHTPDRIEKALNKLCPPWALTDPASAPAIADEIQFFNEQFSFQEFNTALASKRELSTSGMDGIGFDTIKGLSMKYKLLLLDIYNEVFSQASFPDSWRYVFMIFIGKSSGPGLRPISLTSCFCKLFETLVRNRLQWYAEVNHWLPRSQHGFRKGLSCSDNLTNLLLKTEEAFLTGQEVYAAFLDVEGAFDNVNIDILLDKLASLCCSLNTILFIKFITHERIIHTEIDGLKRRSCRGVPQGSVLSPLLYAIYVSPVTEGLPACVHVSQFADDLAIFTVSGDSDSCINTLEHSISTLDRNLVGLGLRIAPSKTNFIHFNRKKIAPGNRQINVGGLAVKSGNNIRFLGVILDYELSFKAQTNNVHAKCSSSLNIIKFLRGTWWGSHPDTLMILYKCFIRSIIDYALFVYLPTTSHLLQKLEKIQFAAIRLALGYRQSTPTNILLAESKLPSIQERARLMGRVYTAKILSNSGSQIFTAIAQFTNFLRHHNSNRILSQCILSLTNSDHTIFSGNNFNLYNHSFQSLFYTIPTNFAIGQSAKNSPNPNLIIEEFINYYHLTPIFTDGSKIPGAPGVGCAFYCPEDDHYSSRTLSPLASIFSAECHAINDALDYITHLSDDRKYIIMSDSLSALMSLQSSNISVKTNHVILDIRERFAALSHGSVSLAWIPSHVGIEGNEAVDALARAATVSPPVASPPVNFTDLAESFRRDCFTNTIVKCEADGLHKDKIYFDLFHRHDKSTPWFTGKNLTRSMIVTINRIRSNHHSLAESLHRKNIISDPGCACGSGEESLNHVLWNCGKFERQRRALWVELARLGLSAPLNTESIVAKPNLSACLALHRFLQNCNLQV
ncbi:hypothetical protein TKK_0015042 [Trichogramma kaykai]